MNNKTFLTSIGVLLVLAMVLTVFTPSVASSQAIGIQPFEGIEITSSLKETDRNSYYGLLSAALKNSFPKVSINDETGERKVVAYPQEFAGSYIDESDTLHILLIKNADVTTKANYQEKMGNDEDIIYETADFSLSRLHEIQDTLDKVMQEFGIQRTAICQRINKVEINLPDSTKEKEITQFLKNTFNDFDEKSITFGGPAEIVTTEYNTAYNALAGSYTRSNDTPLEAATLGFNARDSNGQWGVVTAAHYATAGRVIRNTYVVIGSASVRQFSGTIDAAFIPFPAGISESYKLSGFSSPDDALTHYYIADQYIEEGLSMTKRGYVTGTTTGQIEETSVTIYVDGVGYFSDQVEISNEQQGGDSGCPVFHTIPRAGDVDFRILLGIATFGNTGNNHGYVSKVYNINSILGVTPYYGE